MTKLIFGCGYLGRRVVAEWREQGDEIYAVTRSASRAAEFKSGGLKPIVADVTDRASLNRLPSANTVLFAVGFDRSSKHAIHDVYVDGLKHVLDALPESIDRFIYVSSTGVYGQNNGEIVDEQSPCQPTREGGKACLRAESLLSQHPLGARSIILRLAGIYGPGRIPRLSDIKAGKPLAVPQVGCLNLIHVEDAARVILLAEANALPPCLYVVSDGHPVERVEYYRELAQLIGAAPPVIEKPDTDSPAAQRAGSSKRISNRKMLDELPVKLTYPSYREGLAAIIAAQNERESQ